MTPRGNRRAEKKKKKKKTPVYRGGLVIDTTRKMIPPSESSQMDRENAAVKSSDRLVIDTTRKMIPPGESSQSDRENAAVKSSGKGKEICADDGPPEEYINVKPAKKMKNFNPSVLELVKNPNLDQMRYWSLKDYDDYDNFLIRKWEVRGAWDEADRVYVTIRDPNSKVAWTAKTFYKFQK